MPRRSSETGSQNLLVSSDFRTSGASRNRTGDLLGAIQALSHLSYSPARRQDRQVAWSLVRVRRL
jgi:hypothetical protein